IFVAASRTARSIAETPEELVTSISDTLPSEFTVYRILTAKSPDSSKFGSLTCASLISSGSLRSASVEVCFGSGGLQTLQVRVGTEPSLNDLDCLALQ